MKRGYEEKDAREKPSRKPGKVGEVHDAPFVGYINLQLDADQKASFDAWFASASFWDAYNYQVGDGINVAVKLDPKQEGFLASATQRRPSSPNAGLVVTARARQADIALGRLVYCLTILSHAEKWTDLQPVADPDRW